MIDPHLFSEIAVRASWTTHDIITLLDFTYSLFRFHLISNEVMLSLTGFLWGLI